jgi:Leucine-rich repeat (LRR) protein
MRRLATLAVVVALISPTVAAGQDYTFGDWARDQGYSPGDAMPHVVGAAEAGIDSLDGIGEFDWTTTPTTDLDLHGNQLSSIESGDFSGLTNLTWLWLCDNKLTSIASGDFSGLTILEQLDLSKNRVESVESDAFSGLSKLTGLDLAEADLSNVTAFSLKGCESIRRVSLRNAVLNQGVLASLLDGGKEDLVGIGELSGITSVDLSGIDFANITDLKPLYAMDDLTSIRLVNAKNLDASAFDVLLDNLATIEGTGKEGVLYMTQADFDALNEAGNGLLAVWDAEPGHHVEVVKK